MDYGLLTLCCHLGVVDALHHGRGLLLLSVHGSSCLCSTTQAVHVSLLLVLLLLPQLLSQLLLLLFLHHSWIDLLQLMRRDWSRVAMEIHILV